MKQEIKVGSTDRTVLVFIPDPASTDGSGKTGLLATDLTVSYIRSETDNDVVLVDATGSLSDLSSLTVAHFDWGLREVSSTLAPGLYRLDLADAVFAAGAWTAVVYVMITTSAAAASPMEFILVNYDPVDLFTAAMTESYAALGAAPSLAQILFEMRAMLTEKSVTSITLTTKKLDGTTTAAEYTLDSASAPTSISRSS